MPLCMLLYICKQMLLVQRKILSTLLSEILGGSSGVLAYPIPFVFQWTRVTPMPGQQDFTLTRC